MKIVHTADWHIGKILNDYSLLDDQRYYFDEFIKKLEEIKPDALIIAGDLYDRSVPSGEAIRLLNSILSRIVIDNKIETFIVAGNHDSKERLSFGSEMLEQSGLHISGNIQSEIKRVDFKKASFYLMPYIEPHNIKMLYPDMNLSIKTFDGAMKLYSQPMLEALDGSRLNILVSHGLFGFGASSDATVGGGELIDASIFSDFDYVALGHLHSHRTAGCEKMLFSGSPLKYSIDEAGQNKSFVLLDIDKDKLDIEQISIPPMRDVKIIEGSFDYLSNRENFKRLDDYVFLHITDEMIVLNAISKLKAVFPNVIGLKYVNLAEHVNKDFIKEKSHVSKLSELDLFSEYYESVTQKGLSEEESEYISSVFKTLKKEDFE